jgi:anti-sigma factor RsiW
MKCNMARDYLALDPSGDDAAVQEHIAQCAACAAYGRQHKALDVVLRAEIRWEAPAALSARLLALAEMPPAAIAQLSALRPRPASWYTTLIYALTALAIGFSLAMGWRLIGMLAGQIALQDLFIQVLGGPAQALTQVTTTLPETRYLIDFFLRVRDQLLWLLLAAVVWAVLDRWTPQIDSRRQLPS